MAPKAKSGGAGYAQNRRNHDRAAANALREIIPEEYFDDTLSATDYTTEGKTLMAAKAYIEALQSRPAASTLPFGPTSAPAPQSLTVSPAYRQLVQTFQRVTQFIADIVAQKSGEVTDALKAKIEKINDAFVDLYDELVQEETGL